MESRQKSNGEILPRDFAIESILGILKEMKQKQQYGSVMIFVHAGQITNASKKEDIIFNKPS